ncbi:MAG TPA: PA2778 family cysteine peptidase [Burkholderiaceae bacterium]
MSVRRRGLLAAGLAAGLAGCASFTLPQTAALLAEAPDRLPEGVPEASELDGTPFFPQTELQCGPAALATVLAAAGVEGITPEQLTDEVFLPGRGGSLQLEMRGGARRHGVLPVLLPERLDALLREVAAGRPAVVLLNLGLSFYPVWHYAVVVGHDLGRAEIVLRSGTTRRESMLLRTFEHTWARSGRWAFVVVAPGELPLTAGEDAVTQACIGFERAAAPAEAARAYAAAVARWPASLVLALGLGNARYAAGDMPGAAKAFRTAAERHDSAAAWNNLAQAEVRLGREREARAAARRALARAEAAEPQWLDAARATLAELH